ncbi:DNA-3-methyladenine glycosylase [Oxalobacter aliiformigenes]|uniref:DNA-3-methyladenine glycosylase II n=1 Tax=Oxalobacter aliiformigenes TaxID=2946593 RepID=A0ABY7JJ95_9BURK|nr:DNA-3-methyladenine glycosylase [Oxalobacter aliiformigenes]WAV93160.1 DNA-3-methyladenine glycosylase [Oxalobacter aliiformigenes]WAV95335.1 DNA-3-methyladenine glycosylase [Oxalobacter aliiformigenes]WAV96866.1 DNA-3-methyladenine glycosylase [Oxalobacter aliiformigenes]
MKTDRAERPNGVVHRQNVACTGSLIDPDTWNQACRELSTRDPILGKLIRETEKGRLLSRGEPFQTLVRSIVGQQISVKAADSIWERFRTVCPACTPSEIMQASVDSLGASGLSRRKVEYLKDLAFHFLERKIRTDRWIVMADEEIIADLTRIKGIGRWTAEMFLIFNLLRPDVLPVDDVGLQKGVSKSYFSGKPVSREDIRELAKNWKPWCTVATWYLWRSLTPLPVEY